MLRINVVPPKSLSTCLTRGPGSSARTPPPTFLFLPIHLSNSTAHLSPSDRACRTSARCETIAEAILPSRSLRAESAGLSSAPLGSTASRDDRYIGETLADCQRPFLKNLRQPPPPPAGPAENRGFGPHFSAHGYVVRGALLVPKREQELAELERRCRLPAKAVWNFALEGGKCRGAAPVGAPAESGRRNRREGVVRL